MVRIFFKCIHKDFFFLTKHSLTVYMHIKEHQLFIFNTMNVAIYIISSSDLYCQHLILTFSGNLI